MSAPIRSLSGLVWRVAVRTFCFTAFAIGGVVMSTIVFPAMWLMPGDRDAKLARARRVVGMFFRWLVRILCFTRVMTLDVSGIERLRGSEGVLILANHPTYIDVVVLLSYLPLASCVVKAQLWKNPFYWGVVRAAGYVDNVDSDRFVSDCVGILSKGVSLLVFPEGTRTTPGMRLRFLRGAAYIALRSQRPFLPVLLNCTPPTFTKGECWYRIPDRPFAFRLTVCKPIIIDELISSADDTPIAVRRLTGALEEYFLDRLKIYDNA